MGIGRGEQWISNRYPTLLARFSIVGSVLNSDCSSFAVAQFIPFLIDQYLRHFYMLQLNRNTVLIYHRSVIMSDSMNKNNFRFLLKYF